MAAGADVSKIGLKYNVPVELRKGGSLRLAFKSGYMEESAPVAWQEIGGRRVPVKVAFRVIDGRVGFSVGAYDGSRPLVIDPVYSWHTFYGGTIFDEGFGITLDGSGNIYISGHSLKSWTGPKGQAPLHAHSGNGRDIMVLKLNNNGEYLWHTFFGSGEDRARSIAIDDGGDIYVAGFSEDDWNGPNGAPPVDAGDNGGFFLMKLDGKSGAYKWHTFLYNGYNFHSEDMVSVACAKGSVYITGLSAAHFNGPKDTPPLHYGGGLLVAKFSGSGGAYNWHTFYYGGAFGIAADGNGALYVVGASGNWNSASFPFPTAPLHAHSGVSNIDIFALKLDASGGYQWHTFYGPVGNCYGCEDESGAGIALDGAGNLYVTGYSEKSWNGPSGKPPVNAHSGGNSDLFVLKLATSGGYQWHTFHGGSAFDYGMGVAADGANVYVTGFGGAWSGPDGQTPRHPYTGSFDAFLLSLGVNGAYQWHTFYGSLTNDHGNSIVLDGGGSLYVAGRSSTLWTVEDRVPLNPHTSGNNYDLFALKMGQDCAYTIAPVTKALTSKGGAVTVKVKASKDNCLAPPISNDNDWITVAGNSIKKKSGTVKLAVAALDSSIARTGSLTIGGNAFTVSQKGKVCALGIKPASSGTISAAAATGYFSVSASPSDCAWTAVSSDTSWLTVISGSPGAGNGAVGCHVTANTTGKARNGKVTVTTTQNNKKKIYKVKQGNRY